MQDFITFVLNNWTWLLPVVLSVVEFIILLIFRRDKIIDNSITSRLLFLVVLAERKFGNGHGAEKLDFVLKNFHQIYEGLPVPDSVLKTIIEDILKTPQKKGGK